jgi:hypothetical protein
MSAKVRVSVEIAANYLRMAKMSMGDVMDLMDCARTPAEAAHMRQAYIDSIMADHGMSEPVARERADKNLRFGISYMGVEHLTEIYFPEDSNA